MRGIEIPCAQIVELVTDYLEDALDPEQRQLVDEHLADCPPCHLYLQQIALTRAQLGTVREPDLSDEAWSALRTAFRDLS